MKGYNFGTRSESIGVRPVRIDYQNEYSESGIKYLIKCILKITAFYTLIIIGFLAVNLIIELLIKILSIGD